MDNEIIKILINYGGSIPILVLVIYFVREMAKFKDGNKANSVVNVSKQLDNISQNHLHTLQESIDRMSANLDKHFDRLNDRISDIIIKIDSSKK